MEYQWTQANREGWVVASHPEYKNWVEKFENLATDDGNVKKVTGKVAKEAMLESQLPNTTLSRYHHIS